MKERITITLDKELLNKVDKKIDKVQIRNRSHAVEYMLNQVLSKQKLRKAVILAGGKGTRLRPMTYELPKPLIPIQGKPIIQHIIEHLASQGIRDIILCIGYMSDKIIKELGTGKNLGVNIEYMVEKKPLGTAGPLRLAKDLLEEPFLLLNGDILNRIDVQDMHLAHKGSNSLGTLSLLAVEDPSTYGVAKLKGNKIIGFVEKPKKEEAPSNLVSAGLYILEPEVINYIPEKGYSMVEKDVFPKLAEEGKLNGYIYNGSWFDIGTTENYERAIKGWK
jgi:NDP-sugar pyrophosphorylase family protein